MGYVFRCEMDDPILETPKPTGELKELIDESERVYWDNFDGTSWFGRCIFLSWWCELGTCKFCFRSVTKHKIKHASQARRSLASVIAEAILIKGLGWRIEFLTGGYGVLEEKELSRIIKLVHQVLEEPIWLNLGEMGVPLLEEYRPHVQGLYSSIETMDPKLHKYVCPDKPIEPYVEMMKNAEKLGYRLAMTIIIGLGEKKEDFKLLEEFIKENNIDRITIYALRPVAGTPYTKGPKPEDVAWWVAKTRIAFPKIEMIVGSAHYRIPELSLVLRADANAITKLPATNIFNTKKGQDVENEFIKAKRKTISKFTSEKIYDEADWNGMVDKLDVNDEERELIRKTLSMYLDKMAKKGKVLFNQEEKSNDKQVVDKKERHKEKKSKRELRKQFVDKVRNEDSSKVVALSPDSFNNINSLLIKNDPLSQTLRPDDEDVDEEEPDSCLL